jgi:hypothetical protein
LPSGFDTQDAKPVLGVVEGDPLDQTGQDLGWRARPRCPAKATKCAMWSSIPQPTSSFTITLRSTVPCMTSCRLRRLERAFSAKRSPSSFALWPSEDGQGPHRHSLCQCWRW